MLSSWLRCALQRAASSMPKNAENTNENVFLTIFYWAGHVCHVEPMWSSTWAEIVPKQVQLIGPLLAKIAPKLSPSCGHVGIQAKLCRYAKRVDYYSLVRFLAVSSVRKCFPPAKAVPVEQTIVDSLGSAPKLPHASTR